MTPICPECRSGKHSICATEALDTATDTIVLCGCTHDEGTTND